MTGVSLTALAVAVAGLATAPVSSAGILPVAVPDGYSAVHGKLRTVAAPGILGNDLQIGGGFTADLLNDVDHGTLSLDTDGGFTYRSDAVFVGTDTFTYRVDGGLLGLSNIATVTLSVTNDPPVAKADAYAAIADVEKTVAAPGVLGNDDDADGDDLTMHVVQEPAHGNLNEDDDGSFRYKADADFSGTDAWKYRAWDGFAWSNTVTVTMTVSGPPATPRPTPTPTPRPSLPLPTLIPIPSVISLPTLLPTPTPTPTPSVRPTPGPTDRPTPTPAQSAQPTPSDGAPTDPSDPAGPAGPVASSGGGSSSAAPPSIGPAPSAPVDAFVVPVSEAGSDVQIDAAVSFDSFEWAVPALVLTVPGMLIVLAVLAQGLIGLAWLPLVRRSLGDDRRRRVALARVRPR